MRKASWSRSESGGILIRTSGRLCFSPRPGRGGGSRFKEFHLGGAENSKITDSERNQSVDQLIAMVADVDDILQNQSAADVDYFLKTAGHPFSEEEAGQLKTGFLKATAGNIFSLGLNIPDIRRCWR